MTRYLGITLLVLILCPPAMALRISPLYQYDAANLEAEENSNSYRRITDALRADDFETAAELAGERIGADQLDNRAHLLLVLAWIGQGNQAAINLHLEELQTQLPEVARAIHLELARYYSKISRFYRVHRHLDRIPAADWPTEAYRLEADALERQGRVDDARTAYEKLLARQPGSPDARLALARLGLLSGDTRAAVEHTQRLLEAEPDDTVGLAIAGVALLLENNLAAAEKRFVHLLSLDPRSASARFNLGVINQVAGNSDEAARYFRQAQTSEARIARAIAELEPGSRPVQLDPDDPYGSLAALVNAARSLADGEPADADEAYRSAGDLFIDFRSPGFSVTNYPPADTTASARLLAWTNLLYRQGYFRLTLRALDNASPEETSAFTAITAARAAWKLGDEDRATGLYLQTGARYPQLLTPMLENADIAFYRGDTATAIAAYERIVADHPDRQSIALRLASLYNAANQSDKAIAQYKQITDKRLLAHAEDQIASTLLERMDDPQGALGHILRARQLDSRNTAIQYTQAAIYFALGKYKESAQLYRLLSRTYDGDATFYFQAGKAFLRVGDNDQAARHLEQALNFGQPFDGDADAEDMLQTIWDAQPVQAGL